MKWQFPFGFSSAGVGAAIVPPADHVAPVCPDMSTYYTPLIPIEGGRLWALMHCCGGSRR